MDKKLAKMLEPGIHLNFVVMLIFAGITAFFSKWLAGVELVMVILLFIYYKERTKMRRSSMRKYVETLAFQVDNASKNTIANFPLPMAIMRLDTGEVVWENDQFEAIVKGKTRFSAEHITEVIPGFDTRWLMEGKSVCPFDVSVEGRRYTAYGNLVKSGSMEGGNLLATLFLVDITDYSELRDRFQRVHPVVAIIMIDSYEELFKGLSESEKSGLVAAIDSQLMHWSRPAEGIMRKLERDRYLFIFENQDLVDFIGDKFSVLEAMRNIKNSEGIPTSLSIGIGKGENSSLAELYSFASLGIDMALSRGGDQVVIKSPAGFEFYGGRAKEVEKRTKVKSRVMANALRQLIEDSSKVFVMGHVVSDLDSIGAAAGIVAAVRKCQKTPYIVCNTEVTSARELIDRLNAAPEYRGVFITPEEAMIVSDAQSLLVVVDTTRPEIVEAPELLEAIQKVAVIDHHRRAASYIEKTAINMHEPYASSACELVTELLQYIAAPSDMLKCEAEALLAGIVLDTKGFTVKTGVRTFEAAAYLKQLGADTIDVRRMFAGNFAGYIERYRLISNARNIFPNITMVTTDEIVDRYVAAQVVDELINISDVDAAFIVFNEESGSTVSARSYGEINVQMVMEKIGGGGSMNMAGAQFPGQSVEEIEPKVIQAISRYLDEIEKEGKQ